MGISLCCWERIARKSTKSDLALEGQDKMMDMIGIF